MADEQPVPDAADQPERPGRIPGSGPRSGRPWWSGTRGTSSDQPGDAGTRPATAPQNDEAATATMWTDRREPILRALDIRIEPLEQLLHRALDELAAARGAQGAFSERTASALRSLHEGLEQAMAQIRETDQRVTAQIGETDQRVTAQIGEADQRAAAAMTDLREQQEKATTAAAQIRTEIAGMTDQLASAVAGLQGSLSGIEERLSAQLGTSWETLWAHVESTSKIASDSITEVVGLAESHRSEAAAAANAAREEMRRGFETLRSDLAGVSRPEDLAAVRSTMREAASQASAAAEAARDRIEALVAQAEKTVEQWQNRAEALVQHMVSSTESLETGFARVDRLASIVESLGRRRGFQELVASEERLREEQAEFVRDLAAASERVAGRVEALGHSIEALERRMEAAVAEAAALRTLPENVSGTLSVQAERLRERMEEVLQARFAQDVERSTKQLRAELERGIPVTDTLRELRALANTQQELARAHERAEQTAAELRQELAGLRKRIEGWGRPGAAPRLAQELQTLEGRVGELEARLADGLPEQIASRVTNDVLQALESKRGRIRRR